MGVWSSISFCSLDKRGNGNINTSESKNCKVTQILNIDSGNFSNTVLQDVQEIRIQEAGYENAIQSRSNDKKKEYLDCLPYFEYSMGGNLKFYKEHLQHDFELEDKVFGSMNNLEPRVRQSSHSDNDSEPESLRYARKPQEKVMPIINTITEEPELSFDDYSSIYQPEFMLNINSQSLVKEMPKKALIENAYLKKAIDNKKKDKSADQNLCQDISDSISKTLVNNVEIHVASKSKVLPVGKGNDVLNKHEDCMFDYQSPLVTTNTKQLEKPQIKSKLNKSTENQRLMSENFDKNTTFSIKNETTSFKLKAVKITNNETTAKHNINETFPTQKQSKTPLDHTSSAPAKNKMRLKYRAQMTDCKEKSKKLGQEEGYNSKNVVMPQLTRKNILPRSKNIQSTDKAQVGSFLSDSEMNIDMVKFNNKDLFDELELTKQTLSEKTLKRSTEFYPESPISEVHFFKTPCSTRHNSLETFEQLESECIEQNIEQDEELQKEITQTSSVHQNYNKLPKEFQEMARRLSKKDSPKKFSASLHHGNSQNLNCSSSSCSTISPRSPSGRTLFRTPSYKMPKTPSLSRQHPSTYVTQHTSSRSKPSSRVSSRATSPTREHIEAFL